MRTYRELFATREFTPFFAAVATQVAGQTVSSLALGVLVFAATDSPLLSALAMFGASLAQVVGAVFLMSAADRLPPRATMAAIQLAFCLGTALLAVPDLPVWTVFLIVACQGLVASVGGGVRLGLLREIVPREGYLIGRSVLNVSVGTLGICGFALGGVLIGLLSARGALLAGAALFLLAALVTRLGLSPRRAREAGRPSVRETWRINRVLWSSRQRRAIYLALWVPNGLIVGAESLFVAYSPADAPVLFVCAAAGMLTGDVLAGRFLPAHLRARLSAPLRLLLAVPYLIFFAQPGLPLAALCVLLASVGFSASLLLQERLVALTPPEISGQALGLQSAGMLTMQGVGAALAGSLAQVSTPALAMGTMAVLSVLVTVSLTSRLASEVRRASWACDS